MLENELYQVLRILRILVQLEHILALSVPYSIFLSWDIIYKSGRKVNSVSQTDAVCPKNSKILI